MSAAVARPVAPSWLGSNPAPHQAMPDLVPLNRYVNRGSE
jgi:hypothetical protein